MEVTFKLNSEEDDYNSKLNRIVKADAMASVLWEINANMYRKFVKYSQKSEDYTQGAEDVIKEIKEMMFDSGINIEELWN